MEKDTKSGNDETLVKDFEKSNFKNMYSSKIIALLILVVVLGIVSGYAISGKSQSATSNAGGILNLSSMSKGTVIGSKDTLTFKDMANGTLKTGGIEGEGAFHLERPGGDSQNVYLTSSSVDLATLVGRKIKVWGQTQKAQHAGWLMDVGRVEVL